MKKNDFSYSIIIVLISLSCVISWKVYFKTYQQVDTVNIHKFPTQISDWSSKDLIITEKEYTILETRNVFVREYKNSKLEKVHLFIVYSQNNRKVSHPPEICYVGGGISVLGNTRDYLIEEGSRNVVQTNKLLLEQGVTQQVAFYWFKVGNTFTSNYWKQQFLIVLKTLLGQPSSSALIRISATIEGHDQPKTESIIKDFSAKVVPLLRTYLP